MHVDILVIDHNRFMRASGVLSPWKLDSNIRILYK